jgi:hypothetical protein
MKTMMASKDNKRKYAYGVEEEAPLKKQRMISRDNSDDDDDDSSSTDNFSSEPEEEVSSEEKEMNLSAGSEEKLLIRGVRSNDRDTSKLESNDSIRNGGDTSDDEEE